MKTNPVAKFTKFYASTTLGCLLAGSLFAAVASDLVPYKGTIWGEIPFTVDFSSEVPALEVEPLSIEPVNMISSHLGQGTQAFSEISFSLNGTYLTCAGTADCLAANGDILRLEFVLTTDGFALNQQFTYSGFFTIIGGGTGRFAFPNTSGLGEGDIINGEGIAVFTGPTTGVLSFSHDFAGTIAVLRGSPKKSK